MCACPRDKVIETYIGVRTLEERGGVNVLVCSCLGERTACVSGGGGDRRGGGRGLASDNELGVYI